MANPLFAYFDTSVLVKRYIDERGSLMARKLLREHRLITSMIALPELVSVLCRRRATMELSGHDLIGILDRLQGDRAHWTLLEVLPIVLARAEELIQRVTLRTLDAIHVASVLTYQTASRSSLPFITADGRQREAAARLALHLVWVE